MLIAKKLLDTRGPSLARRQIEQFRATGFRGPIWGQPAMDKTRELTANRSKWKDNVWRTSRLTTKAPYKDYLGQALLLQRPDPALRIGIQLHPARRQYQRFNST